MPSYHKNVKCVIVGDVGSGKKTLIFSYISRKPELQNYPIVYKPPNRRLKMGNYRINLSIYDTKGHPKYDDLRPLCYPLTDVFIICFSLINGTTFDSVWTKWYPEIEHHCKNNIPVLLVGTKLDLRDIKLNMVDKNNQEFRVSEQTQCVKQISCQEGMKMAESIGAEKYIECSALINKSIEAVFDTAVKMVLSRVPTYVKKRRCLLF